MNIYDRYRTNRQADPLVPIFTFRVAQNGTAPVSFFYSRRCVLLLGSLVQDLHVMRLHRNSFSRPMKATQEIFEEHYEILLGLVTMFPIII